MEEPFVFKSNSHQSALFKADYLSQLRLRQPSIRCANRRIVNAERIAEQNHRSRTEAVPIGGDGVNPMARGLEMREPVSIAIL